MKPVMFASLPGARQLTAWQEVTGRDLPGEPVKLGLRMEIGNYRAEFYIPADGKPPKLTPIGQLTRNRKPRPRSHWSPPPAKSCAR